MQGQRGGGVVGAAVGGGGNQVEPMVSGAQKTRGHERMPTGTTTFRLNCSFQDWYPCCCVQPQHILYSLCVHIHVHLHLHIQIHIYIYISALKVESKW